MGPAQKPYIAKYKAKLAAGNYKQKNNSYTGMVQSLDESVGRVLAILKKKGFEKKTIVIFTGDNGGDSIHRSGGLRQRKGLAYKLIEFFEEGTLELYNLKTDAAESKNLAAELPEKTKELYGMLKKWRVEVKAQMPTANPNYRWLFFDSEFFYFLN